MALTSCAAAARHAVTIVAGHSLPHAPVTDGTGISGPTNVQRVVHVEWDSKTGTFKGLPSVWKSALPEGGGGIDRSSCVAGAGHLCVYIV